MNRRNCLLIDEVIDRVIDVFDNYLSNVYYRFINKELINSFNRQNKEGINETFT